MVHVRCRRIAQLTITALWAGALALAAPQGSAPLPGLAVPYVPIIRTDAPAPAASAPAAVAAPAPKPLTVTIVNPKTKSVVHGTLVVVASPTGDGNFTYAVLCVDDQGRNLTNTLPLRFQLDTLKLENGPHTLRVDLCDASGPLVSSREVSIMVVNPAVETTHVPAPNAQPPSAGAQANGNTTPAMPVPALTAPSGLRVMLDGQLLLFAEPPYQRNFHTMVMLRPLIEVCGGTVTWKDNKALALFPTHTLQFTLGQNAVEVDGKLVTMSEPMVLRNDRAMVPVTVWKQVFGGLVNFNDEYQIVTLRSHDALVAAKLAE